MQSTTKRHPASIRLRIGATKDGRLCGMEFDGDFNTGAYSSWGPTVATRVPIHASGPYRIADYTARSRGVYTNCAPSGAFRGFGVPQSAFAQETTLDALAQKLGIDPLEFRIMNALDNGVPTVCGQVFSQGVGIKKCLEALRPAWAAAKAECASFNAGSACHEARRRRRGWLVWLRQYLNAQSLDHQGRSYVRWCNRPAPGRGGYRPRLEHGNRADLRAGARRAI